MSRPFKVLVVLDDPGATAVIRQSLESESGVRLLVARDLPDGLTVARFARPDLVLLGSVGEAVEVAEACQRLRAEPGLSFSTLVVVTPPGAPEMRQAALLAGADDFLSHPVQTVDVLAKLRLQLRLQQTRNQLERDRLEIERLRKLCGKNADRVVNLLVSVIESGLPGAGERGRRIAELARRIAARFGVPALRLGDLDIAAHVHEIGRLVSAAAVGGAQTGIVTPAWQHAVCTESLLSRAEGLQEAASLIGSLYENWDGTGFPGRLQQGQIPLRSRILRVLVDFFTGIQRPGAVSQNDVLACLEAHAGTLYDPMVLVHLQAVLNEEPDREWCPGRILLPVTELSVGMVLAEDLCTDSGLKLLARGTPLTPTALETILRRHRVEPILQGAAVLRRAA